MSINSVAVSAVGVMVAVVVGAARADGPVYPPTPVASDWCAMGTDCSLIGAGDLDGDGFAELLTINGNRDLCSAVNVQGWKSGGWIAVRGEMPADATGFVVAEIDAAAKGPEVVVVSPGCALLVSRYDQDKYQDAKRLDASPGTTFVGAAVREGAIVITDSAGKYWRVEGGELRAVEALGAESAETSLQISPPPYEPAAKLLTMCSGDFTGDGKPDRAGLFDATIPHPHRVVRVVMAPDDRGPAERLDRDFDGLTDAEETAIGSNPLDRDTDMDGLLDGWEVKGLPRGIALGDRIRLFDPSDPKAHGTLSPLRQDVICVLSYFEGVDPKQMEAELPRVEALYRDLSNKNPDGSTGLWVHFRVEKTFVSKADQGMPWWDVGNKYFAANERGFLHWLQITPWGGGQSGQTADMGGAGNNWAVIAHEFGHQLSLSHEGDSAAPWCPLYTSLMSYAFSYGFDGDGNRIHFSKGQFRQTELDERKLDEKLNYPYDQVKYLANWPYRFTLKDTGNGQTLIDWNHNGTFDETPVQADVNYGGSTNAGIRNNHELSGSGPALAYVGDVCYLVAADQTRDHLWIKSYQGSDTWSDKRVIPNSGTEREPVIVGGKDHGLVFHHHLYGWHVTRFDAGTVGAPVKVPGLPPTELSACRVGDRVLLVSRRDGDTLEYRWLTFTDGDVNKPVVSGALPLEVRSLVAPGLGVDPADGRLIIATSMNNSHGAPYCMRVTRAAVQGDRLWEQETVWTRGEASGNGCCSKPVVAFTPAGQLTIFHQGGPDASGQMIAYRTMRVGNTALDEGWLTCMLYDVWTRSRVPVAFASGPQGAIFSYRWDAGGTNNMLQTAHNGFGIDTVPMRDFDDGAKIALWGIRHAKLQAMRK
ncbi:MAG: hypothetical protein AMXMBFR58_35060 [Phycisphaerae bacterium]